MARSARNKDVGERGDKDQGNRDQGNRDRNDRPSPPRARRPRLRYAPDDGGGRVARPLLVALILVLAVAAFLFWPRGGGVPTGIGEQLTVVTARDSAGAVHARPHSGNVDIDKAATPIVAEKPAGKPSETAASPSQPAAKPHGKASTEPRPAAQSSLGTPTGSAELKDAVPITPRSDGPYALQLGSFSSEANALSLRDRFTTLGYPMHVRAASTSDGAIVYRVWVGFFASRQQAQLYATSHSPELADAIAVHR